MDRRNFKTAAEATKRIIPSARKRLIIDLLFEKAQKEANYQNVKRCLRQSMLSSFVKFNPANAQKHTPKNQSLFCHGFSKPFPPLPYTVCNTATGCNSDNDFFELFHPPAKMENSKKSKSETMQWARERAWFWFNEIEKCTMISTRDRCKKLSIEFCNIYKSLNSSHYEN